MIQWQSMDSIKSSASAELFKYKKYDKNSSVLGEVFYQARMAGEVKYMYVKRVFYDDLNYSDDFEKEIELPSWEEIDELIDRMDGRVITQITMDNGHEDNYFCIGGGNEGLYNIFISENDNEIVWTLVKDDNGLKVYNLVTGGQEGEFEGRLCVTIEIVKEVAKFYYQTGKKSNDYIWE